MMFKKSLTLLAVLGIAAYVQTQPASAQAALSCFDPNGDGRAMLERNPVMQPPEILQMIGAQGQLISAEFCRAPDGTLVWVITERSGGAVIRRVVNAVTGALVPGL